MTPKDRRLGQPLSAHPEANRSARITAPLGARKSKHQIPQEITALFEQPLVQPKDWTRALAKAPPHQEWWNDLCDWVQLHPHPLAPAALRKSSKGLAERGWAWIQGGRLVVKRLSELRKGARLSSPRLQMVFFHTGLRWEADGYLGELAGIVLGSASARPPAAALDVEGEQLELIRRLEDIEAKAREIGASDPKKLALHHAIQDGVLKMGSRTRADYLKQISSFEKLLNETPASRPEHQAAEQLLNSVQDLREDLKGLMTSGRQSIQFCWMLKSAIDLGMRYQRMILQSDPALMAANVKGARMTGKGRSDLRLAIDKALKELKRDDNPSKREVLRHLGAKITQPKFSSLDPQFNIDGKCYTEKEFDRTLKNARRCQAHE